MDKKQLVFYGLIVCMLIPPIMLGSTTGDGSAYGAKELSAEAANLQAFLFGAVLRVAAIVGAIFGIIRAFQTQSLQPILIFGSIGAFTIIIPKVLAVMFKVA